MGAVFVYPNDRDSVLLVDPADYNACNTSSYVTRFDDGDTVFVLDHSGAFFFISGVEANCRANEKLIVMVVGGAGAPGGSPSPTPSAPAPSSGGDAKAPPSSSPNAPAAKNSTAKGAPHAAGGSGSDKNGAGLTVAGFLASFVGCIAYATLAF